MNDYAKNATFAKQAREMGIDCMLMGHDGWDSAQLAGEAEGALENCLYVSRIGFSTPEAKAFGEEVAKAYNITMEGECLFGHDGVMWLVDAIFEYRELGASYFTPDLESLVNDAFLGLSVVALALVIWIVNLLITDPKHVVRNELIHKS